MALTTSNSRSGTFSRPAPVALLGLLLAACPRAPLPPDTLVLLVEFPPETLDRRLAVSAIAENVSGNLIEPGILRIDDDGRPVPDLAESFTQLDPLTYEALLRPGLRFQDGSQVTAADVVASYDTLRDPGFHSPLASRYGALAQVTALDERRVRFVLKQPAAGFPVDLIMGVVPRDPASIEHADFGRHPIGAGPFRFVAWPDDEHLLLEANPYYYGGRPAAGHLLIKTVRDENTRALELLHGKADLCFNAISPPLLALLAGAPGLDILSRPGANAAYLMFRLDDPKLRDVRVRRAIGEGIDRAAIARYKFGGHATPATTLLPPGNWARDGQLAELPYDPAGAAELLDAAGLKPDARGIRLSLDYKTSTDRFRRSIGLVLVDQLARIGIDVALSSLEFGTFFADVRKGNFEMATLKWVPIIDPDLYSLVFASSSIPTPENNYNGANRGRYLNPEVDALLAAGKRGGSEAERRQSYAQVQEILARDLPYVVLWYEDSTAVVRKGLTGVSLSPFGFFSSLARVQPLKSAGASLAKVQPLKFAGAGAGATGARVRPLEARP
jgi:peptide/nickel transport system substrate-binding protein